VVEGCREIRANGSVAQLLARDSTNDLALIGTGLHRTQWVSWRFSVRQGEEVVVYGFPLAGVLSSGGNVVTGNVTALAGLADDSRLLQISAPVQPGNSGGPLLDRRGNVVGIVVSKLNALRIASATGDIPQNVNFAIKASVALAFLDAHNVAHSERPAATEALTTPEIATRGQAQVAQVLCIK
jgi:serine protease Do